MNTGRTINATGMWPAEVEANAYSMAMWAAEKVRVRKTISLADLINPAGNRVSQNSGSLISAMNDFSPDPNSNLLVLGGGAGSWPLAAYHQFLVHKSTMADCVKAQSLVDWIYWTQTDPAALDLARKYDGLYSQHMCGLSRAVFRNHLAVPAQSSAMRKRLINFISSITCNGEHVSSIYGCIYQDTVCSDRGVCTAQQTCLCQPGFAGRYCEALIAESSSRAPLGAILGGAVPAAILSMAIVACMICLFLLRKRKKRDEDWMMDVSELEVGELLGAGGYVSVHQN